jgi:transcriptional regulator with XRE-family HTH domain
MPKPRKSLFDESYREIIRCLIARRKELGMSQTELAEKYGEDQSFISRIERMQRRLDIYEYTVFCRILRIVPGEILQAIWEKLPDPDGFLDDGHGLP